MLKRSSYLLFAFFLFVQTVYTETEISHIYHQVLKNCDALPTRIDKLTGYFLGKRYLQGALGEGCSGIIDINPLYRLDAFDCQTFVSTVLALAESQEKAEFVTHLKRIQYKDANVSYFNRLHFTDLDWNIANEHQGYLENITHCICQDYKLAHASIDKRRWYTEHNQQSIPSLAERSSIEIVKVLQILHQHAKLEKIYQVSTSYIPLTEILHPNTTGWVINNELLARIPSGAIIEIVDKTKDFKRKIGTDLNIVHLGFAIRTPEGLMFRHASKVHQQVVEVPILQYLERYYMLSDQPEKIGIHIENPKFVMPVLDGSPLSRG